MGIISTRVKENLIPIFPNNKQIQILMVGVDSVGKSTMLQRLGFGELKQKSYAEHLIDTEVIEKDNIKIIAWDLGGQPRRLKRLLYVREFLPHTHGVIFVVDSNDRERMEEVAEEIELFAKEEELREVPFLILANKQDLPNALSPVDISDLLRLPHLSYRKWFIQGCSAEEASEEQAKELFGGFKWMSDAIFHDTTIS
eukprot:TRINITY_DN4025_c0_g1_i3.p1 TRINITY_DN4025_c0_g1~~TRINITY_DN4025_c0_g1_i3.p1  ORF type:complete len:198 (-),score=46.22 TRINITY_DN4025_c0_g1_i3:83-676(-)